MTQTNVNPHAQNPLYPEAMQLAQVKDDTQFITFDTRRGGLSLTTSATTWRTDVRPVIHSLWEDEPLATVPDIVTDDVLGKTLSLPQRGVHPFLADGAWDTRHFSVVVARETILKFYFWLERQGFPRSANWVKDRFFDYFVVDWNQLLKQGLA